MPGVVVSHLGSSWLSRLRCLRRTPGDTFANRGSDGLANKQPDSGTQHAEAHGDSDSVTDGGADAVAHSRSYGIANSCDCRCREFSHEYFAAESLQISGIRAGERS